MTPAQTEQAIERQTFDYAWSVLESALDDVGCTCPANGPDFVLCLVCITQATVSDMRSQFEQMEERTRDARIAANVTIAQAGGWEFRPRYESSTIQGMDPWWAYIGGKSQVNVHAQTFPELAALAAAEVLK